MAIKGKTESGFEFSIDEEVLASHKFRRLITAMNRGSKGKIGDDALLDFMYELEELLLGDRVEELENHMSKAYGHMATDKEVTSEITDIIRKASSASNDVKKS